MSRKEILMQPNNLIKSKYDFSSIENKLFYKMLFNAQKQNAYSNSYTTTITKDELKSFMKNKNDFEYRNTKDILNMFQLSVLEFDYIDDTNGKLKTFSSGLILSYELDHSEQVYTIEIHKTLYKHITDFVKMQSIGNGYTPIDLSLLFNFRGVYSQRLYTLFRLWSREHKCIDVKYKLDELRNLLKLKDDVYPQYKYFKQNVIKRALKEINEKGNMKVDIKQEIRKGRKVDEIVFSVIDYEPRQYFKKDSKLEECMETKEDNTIDITYNKDFYLPDKEVFTKGTLRSFKLDFKGIDFKNEYMNRAFNDSVMITLDRDNVDKIKANSYKYFKRTLENKILEYMKEEELDIKHQKEMALNW